ncbi:MAG: hypothetical protein J6S67_11535 [Methanobrevibacter sp.]|nr:hypothetical protein [Methanobrevibacter sp.]
MKAPEKIYFDGESKACKLAVFSSCNIEYTRTDAFIEKACAFLRDRIEHDSIDYPMATHYLIDDFKNYMKGE